MVKYILLFFTLFSYSQKHILIGDSQTFYLSKYTKEIKCVKRLTKSGIGVIRLNKKVTSYPISPDVNSVSVCIGVNDYYRDIGVRKLMETIKRTFPNSIIYVIQGSWGWGGVKKIKTSSISKYYKRFQNLGGVIIELPIGYGDPHKDKESYKTIIDSLECIITR